MIIEEAGGHAATCDERAKLCSKETIQVLTLTLLLYESTTLRLYEFQSQSQYSLTLKWPSNQQITLRQHKVTLDDLDLQLEWNRTVWCSWMMQEEHTWCAWSTNYTCTVLQGHTPRLKTPLRNVLRNRSHVKGWNSIPLAWELGVPIQIRTSRLASDVQIKPWLSVAF